MADDLHYVPGSFYRICDRTGFKIRADKTRAEWTTRIIRTQSWEARQPQDFVRGVADPQYVPDARPQQQNVFIGPLTTTLSSNAAPGTNTLNVASFVGMSIGDRIEIILDGDADTFLTTIIRLPGGFSSGFSGGFATVSIQLADPFPRSASAGNLVTDISQVIQPNIG